MQKVFANACTVEVVDDGLRFDAESIVTDDIRDDQEYHGIRVRLVGYLGNARIAIQIDVGFGDAITPAPTTIDYPAILDFPPPRIRAYHPATVVAEKFNAMVILGMMNSRLKDFYDVYTILQHMGLDESQLADAIHATFRRRKTPLPIEPPLVFTDDFINDGNKEIQWKAFLKRSLLTDCKFSFNQIVGCIRQKLWPVICQLNSAENQQDN
jgi:NACalpha-BTF3-like transcription factor